MSSEVVAQTRGSERLHLFGASLNSAPIEVLERLSLSREEVALFYQRLSGVKEVTDALILSTCNRTEIYVSAAESISNIGSRLWEVLKEIIGSTRLPDGEHRYAYSGGTGLNHLFRVSCGLDSVILGEAQILGQVKDAYEGSRSYFQSTYFERVLQSAFRVAGRSRAETAIGVGAVSVASAGVHLTNRIFSDYGDRTVVVVGAGDTGRLVAQHFAEKHPGRLVILNRTLERANEVAAISGGEAWPMTRMEEALVEADVVVTAIRTTSSLLDRALMEKIMKSRGNRMVAILDLGLPRNVKQDVNELFNVFLNDIDTLKRVVDGNLKHRQKEIPKVEVFIEEEIARLMDWQRSFEVGPLIGALRGRFEEIRQKEVARATRGMGSTEIAAVDRTTRAVVNKLLHGPVQAIHDYARQVEAGNENLAVIQKLFGTLSEDDDASGESGEE